MMLKKLKIVLISIVLVLLFVFSMSACFAPSDGNDPAPVPEGAEVVQGNDGRTYYYYENEEDFLKRANELAKQKTQKSCFHPLVAHADVLITPEDINTFTRFVNGFADGYKDGNLGKAIKGLVNSWTNRLDGTSITGSGAEIPATYAVAGKTRLQYQGYDSSIGKYRDYFGETVTVFANIGAGGTALSSSTLEDLGFPFWMGEPLQSNEVAFMRVLDSGDTYQFKVHPADYNNVTGLAGNKAWYGASSNDGFYFCPVNYNTMTMIDSQGSHTWQGSYNDRWRFITNTVNNIDYVWKMEYNPSSLNYSTSLSIANGLRTFYCSYAVTNDNGVHEHDIINETIINNWTSVKFPVYRTNIFNTGDTITENNVTNYYDYGITNNNGTLSIDPTVFAGAVVGALLPEVQAAFDGVFELQPDIGATFSPENNVNNYLEITDPPAPVVTGVVVDWEEPSYPAITTYGFQIEPQFPETTYTTPAYLPETASEIYSVADRLLGPELLPIFLFLGLLGLCVSILM